MDKVQNSLIQRGNQFQNCPNVGVHQRSQIGHFRFRPEFQTVKQSRIRNQSTTIQPQKWATGCENCYSM